MKAVKILSPGQAAVVEVPIPKLRPDYVLVKTKAIALNPTDWKHVDRAATPHATVGCDYSGVIEAVGGAVPTDLGLKKGDRVAGFVHGANAVELEDGAFGEWLVAKAGLVMKIPDDMSFEDASALGVGVVTVGQGMYQSMGLPWPEVGKETVEKNGPILIYGGSTATGAYAIQFAKL